MSNIQRMRSQYEDNNGMTGTDDESYSDNEGGRKSADLKPKQAGVNKNSEDYKKRRQRNNEGLDLRIRLP